MQIKEMEFKEEEFRAWIDKIQKYEMFSNDKICYVLYRSKIYGMWDVSLRSLRIAFNSNQDIFLEYFRESPSVLELEKKFSINPKSIIELSENFLNLDTRFFDKDNSCFVSGLLKETNLFPFYESNSLVNMDNIILSEPFRGITYNFVRFYYPMYDVNEKRRLLLSLCRYVYLRNREGQDLLERVQTIIFSSFIWWIVNATYLSMSKSKSIFDEDLLSTLSHFNQEKEKIERDLVLIQYIFDNIKRTPNIPSLSFLERKNSQKQAYDLFKKSLENTPLRELASLI